MNYPQWDVPGIGSGWVVGLIAIFHIPIAHFAVGGGIYLWLAERLALKHNRRDWLPILAQHSKFFLILTSVFGTVSGVGIWFAIGLVHPEATSTLIHNFVFGWAIEWTFFVIELAAGAAYYYTWNRIPDKLHSQIGALYAVASICTMVIINGILTFMLTPGDTWLSVAGTGQEASKFWNAFFNPTYWPSLLLRLLSAAALAGVWALVSLVKHSEEESEKPRLQIIKWSAQWLVPMFVLMPFAMAWYYFSIPDNSKALLQLGMTTVGSGAFTQITRIGLISMMTTATIAGVVYFFAYKSPRDFTYGHALSVLVLAVGATASTEYAREGIRKPFVIGSHMYSSGIRISEIDKYNKEGYLKDSLWAASSHSDTYKKGELMFAGQCLACHTRTGYRSMVKLLGGRDAKGITMLLNMLHNSKPGDSYNRYMPPLVGTKEELDALAFYMSGLTPQGKEAVAKKREEEREKQRSAKKANERNLIGTQPPLAMMR